MTQSGHTRENSAKRNAAPGTIEKYLRDITSFAAWLDSRELDIETVIAWKEHLLAERYQPGTINSMLSALNGYFRFIGREDCRAKFLRVQRKMFRDPARDLCKDDYERLLQTAGAIGNTRLRLLMETICATGIRVSELKYITVEAAKAGRAQISLKGKIRIILLPGNLCRKLQKYAHKQKIASGEIFLTRSGKSLSQASGLAGDETAVRPSGCGAEQSISPQPAAPVRRHPL